MKEKDQTEERLFSLLCSYVRPDSDQSETEHRSQVTNEGIFIRYHRSSDSHVFTFEISIIQGSYRYRYAGIIQTETQSARYEEMETYIDGIREHSVLWEDERANRWFLFEFLDAFQSIVH